MSLLEDKLDLWWRLTYYIFIEMGPIIPFYEDDNDDFVSISKGHRLISNAFM